MRIVQIYMHVLSQPTRPRLLTIYLSDIRLVAEPGSRIAEPGIGNGNHSRQTIFFSGYEQLVPIAVGVGVKSAGVSVFGENSRNLGRFVSDA